MCKVYYITIIRTGIITEDLLCLAEKTTMTEAYLHLVIVGGRPRNTKEIQMAGRKCHIQQQQTKTPEAAKRITICSRISLVICGNEQLDICLKNSNKNNF